ncbi:hypothetical protein BLA60_25990 [Actinophytocola xinjiangensis]|uniref:Uncharacterized protein n=1 Tax=Actinophytocola xinjiangensis TaxID=485602 RepID=A0A7Z1AVW6_9PSEU|nr:hypothetical protein BLA60_25990 [Actinophytocola xinjiangensis]
MAGVGEGYRASRRALLLDDKAADVRPDRAARLAMDGTAPPARTLRRSALCDDFGFPKTEVLARAYWIRGWSMGTVRSSRP